MRLKYCYHLHIGFERENLRIKSYHASSSFDASVLKIHI